MRRLSWRLAAALLAAALWPVAIAAQPTTITVFHVNDTHSHLEAYGPRDWRLEGTLGGLAKAATVVREARAREENSLFLHAGDAFVGDFLFNTTFGVAELTMLKSLGVDAMTLGNHELDLGPGLLTQTLSRLPGGPPPLLSANANTSGCASSPTCAPLTAWIQPSTILEVAGVRVGVFGMTTPDDPTMRPAPVVIEGAGNPAVVVGRAIQTAAELRMRGAQVVILLSHLGLAYDRAIAAQPAPAGLPSPLIDFVVGGHDHLLLPSPVVVGGTRILSAGRFYDHVGRLRFTVDGPHVTFEGYSLLNVGRCVRPDPAVRAQVEALKAQAVAFYKESLYRKVVGWAVQDVRRDAPAGSPWRDTPMGNLVTDAYRQKTRSEVALAAAGYIADVLYRGPIVGADVFHAVPYGYDTTSGKNYPLVVIGLRGSELLRGVETTLAYLEVTDALFLQVSGLRYAYDPRRPVGSRLVAASVNGEPVDMDRVYSVTVNAAVYVFARDSMRLAIESTVLPGVTEYDAVRDRVARLVFVRNRREGRVIDVARTATGP